MKVHNVRINMVWLLVMVLLLILSVRTGQTTDANKDGDKIAPGRIEKQKTADKSKIQAASAPVSSKIYVENDVKGTGQAAIFGEATAISAIGYDIVNYGGYFTAAGVKGRGVYGEALYSGNFENFGGYFIAQGDKGVGVYGSAPSYGGYFQADGVTSIAVYGYATNNDRDAANYGGFFKAEGDKGVGVSGWGNKWDFYAAGDGINYYPFTGAHEVKFEADMPQRDLDGLIVSVTGKAHVRRKENGRVCLSSTLPTVTFSNKANDKAVFGVIVSEDPLPKDHWYKPEEGERFGGVNALGEGRVWVTNCNGNIEAGDYITTSEIPGYGQMQDDDLLHSYTLGKAIETIDWDRVAETVQHDGQTYKRYLLAVVYTSG